MYTLVRRISWRWLLMPLLLVLLATLLLFGSTKVRAAFDASQGKVPARGCTWQQVGTNSQQSLDDSGSFIYRVTTTIYASYDSIGDYCGTVYGEASLTVSYHSANDYGIVAPGGTLEELLSIDQGSNSVAGAHITVSGVSSQDTPTVFVGGPNDIHGSAGDPGGFQAHCVTNLALFTIQNTNVPVVLPSDTVCLR